MKALPEEVTLTVLRLLDDVSLLGCAQVSRAFNRLAIQQGLEKHHIWDATQHCDIEIRYNLITHSIDALSFLLYSVHIKSFRRLSLEFHDCRRNDTASVAQKLCRITAFLEKVDTVVYLRLICPLAGLKWDMDAGTTSVPIGKALEGFLNLIVSKPTCRFIRLFDWSEATIKGYELRDKDQDTLSSKSVEEDESKYVRSEAEAGSEENLGPLSIEYQPKEAPTSDSPLNSIAVTPQLLRPPLSQWTFSLLNAVRPGTFTYSVDYAVPEKESQFILSRLANFTSERLYLFIVINPSGLLRGILTDIRFFAHNLCQLDIQANATNENCDQGLHLDFPNLERIRTTPSILHAIFSAKNHIHMPKLERVIVLVDAKPTIGEPFDIAAFAQAIATTRNRVDTVFKHTPGDKPSSTGSTTLTSTHPPIAIGAEVDFSSTTSSFEGLTENLRRGIRPDLGSDVLSNALKAVEDATISLFATPQEIQQGKFKEELMAFATAFTGLTKLNVACCKGRGSGIPLEPSLFDSLQFRCPSLIQVRVC